MGRQKQSMNMTYAYQKALNTESQNGNMKITSANLKEATWVGVTHEDALHINIGRYWFQGPDKTTQGRAKVIGQ